MASILKGQSGQPIQFETTPNVNGDDVATEQFALDNDLGVGQTWQNVAASRSAGVTYTNNTGKPIVVYVAVSALNTSLMRCNIFVNGLEVASTTEMTTTTNAGSYANFSAIVPNGSTYKVNYLGAGAFKMDKWVELR